MPSHVQRWTAPCAAAESLESRTLMDATTGGIAAPVAPDGVPQGTFIGQFGAAGPRHDRFSFFDLDHCKVTITISDATCAVYRDGLETHLTSTISAAAGVERRSSSAERAASSRAVRGWET